MRYRPLTCRRPRLRFSQVGKSPSLLAVLLAELGSTAKGVFTSPSTTTVIATGVGQWNDQSGTGNLIQLTGANQPTLTSAGGRTWVTFGATDVLTRAAVGVGPNFDLFVRFRYSMANPHAVCLSFGGANNDWAWYVENGSVVKPLRLNISAGANVAPTLAANTTAIIHFRGDGNAGWEAAWAGFVGKDTLAATACSLDFASDGALHVGPNQSGSLGDTLVSDIILLDGASADGRQAALDYLNAT